MDFSESQQIKSKIRHSEYYNLIIHKDIHRLIHTVDKPIINYYLEKHSLNNTQINNINILRNKAGLQPI